VTSESQSGPKAFLYILSVVNINPEGRIPILGAFSGDISSDFYRVSLPPLPCQSGWSRKKLFFN